MSAPHLAVFVHDTRLSAEQRNEQLRTTILKCLRKQLKHIDDFQKLMDVLAIVENIAESVGGDEDNQEEDIEDSDGEVEDQEESE